MAVYATLDDLGAYLGKEPPAGAQALLARASERIDAALISSSWTIDAGTGLPSVAATAAAFKLAACQQAESWINSGDEFEESEGYSSWAIEGMSVTRDKEAQRSPLCRRAYETLRTVTAGTPYSLPLLPGKPGI